MRRGAPRHLLHRRPYRRGALSITSSFVVRRGEVPTGHWTPNFRRERRECSPPGATDRASRSRRLGLGAPNFAPLRPVTRSDLPRRQQRRARRGFARGGSALPGRSQRSVSACVPIVTLEILAASPERLSPSPWCERSFSRARSIHASISCLAPCDIRARPRVANDASGRFESAFRALFDQGDPDPVPLRACPMATGAVLDARSFT